MELMSHADPLVLAAATGSLLFCTAVNCYTYRIAYPLWRFVGEREFSTMQREYMRRLGPVITAPHVLAFLSTGTWLFRRPVWLSTVAAIYIFVSVTIVILLSLVIAGPVHSRFERNGTIDFPGMDRLEGVSAVRSVLLLTASALLLLQMSTALSPSTSPVP